MVNASQTEEQRCVGPSTDVNVLAQVERAGTTFIFDVHNGSPKAITILTLGDGNKSELRISDFAMPKEISGPLGWRGISTPIEESLYMHWVWTASQPEIKISPKKWLGGFKVILPAFPTSRRGQLYPDGTIVKPISAVDLPFRVYFADGSCVWGRVKAK